MVYKLYELDLTEEEKKYWRPKYHSYFQINGNQIEVPHDIFKLVEQDGVHVVHFISQGKEIHYDPSRNIWGYDCSGNKLWEIENRFDSMGLQKDPNWFDNYTGFHFANNIIEVGSFDGFTGILDVRTGKVRDWQQGK